MRYIYGVITGYVLCLFVSMYGYENLVDRILEIIDRVRQGIN